jgi:hypothetical protein
VKYLFIDESGTHTLDIDKLDPTFPFFVLTGIIFEKEQYQRFQRSFINLKKGIFGTEKVILHSLELTRTVKARQPELKIFANPELRKEFYKKLNNVIATTNFSITAFVIDKRWYSNQFIANPIDPYFLCFNLLFEIYEKELKKMEAGSIYAEQRNPRLDKQVLLAWESAKLTVTGDAKEEARLDKLKNHNISVPHIVHKSYENNGLELADLVSYRIARVVQKKGNKPLGNELDIEIILRKIINIDSLPLDLDLHPLR